MTLIRGILIGAIAMAADVALAHDIDLLDACDPATFNAEVGPGTCEDVGGNVTVEEFGSPGVIPAGHPAWANSPSYITINYVDEVKVTNRGGMVHTLTEVAKFGGGYIPILNPAGLTDVAPECGSAGVPSPNLVVIPSGGQMQLRGLSTGTHLFQCCLHPWMRAAVKVTD